MLNVPSRTQLAWVAAALMVVALPSAKSAFAATVPSAQLLSSQLPAGVTLSRASASQLAGALHTAVAKDPQRAASLTAAAINAKKKSTGMNCSLLRSFVDSAMSAAPSKSREIIEAAMAAMPECSEAMTRLLGSLPASARGTGNAVAPAGGIGTVGEVATQDASGFGAGLGSGFPGSPGFSGSAPSGAFAFPTVTSTSLTSTTNP